MKRHTKILMLVITLLLIVLAFLFIYQVNKLNIAHSTFENYYNFRGCTQLVNRTEASGFCYTGSGQTIEIVKYNGKWYLNGDLPGGFLDW